MQPHQTLVNSSFSKNKSSKIRYFILIVFLLSFSLNSSAQSITKGVGNIGDDSVFDMVSHDGINYLFATVGSSNDSTIYVGNNKIKLNCYVPSIIAFDDSFNIVNSFCFENPTGTRPFIVHYEKGKILYDTISNSIIIGGSFRGTVIINSDTLQTGANQLSSFFVAKFDSNLSPIWGVSSDCNSYFNTVFATVNDIAVDKDGKVFAAIEADDEDEKLCFVNDSIITIGRINIDTNNTIKVSKIVPTLIAISNNNHTLCMLDDYKLLKLYNNTMQLIDSRVDTVIWQKNIGYSPNTRFLAVDTKHKVFYLIHNTHFDQLKKYDFAGNLIWQKSISDLKEPLGIDVTADGKKVYLSGFSNNSRHKIYVVDSSGNSLESTNWANHLQAGNSLFFKNKSVQINNNKLFLTFESYNRTLTFGNDTINYSPTRRYDIYISIIDINQVLTDVNDIQSYNNTPFKVYPIPFNTFVNIEGNQKINAVEMYSIDGKLIKTKHSNSFNTLHFPNNLEKGIYFLRIYANPNIFNIKIIK